MKSVLCLSNVEWGGGTKPYEGDYCLTSEGREQLALGEVRSWCALSCWVMLKTM